MLLLCYFYFHHHQPNTVVWIKHSNGKKSVVTPTTDPYRHTIPRTAVLYDYDIQRKVYNNYYNTYSYEKSEARRIIIIMFAGAIGQIFYLFAAHTK